MISKLLSHSTYQQVFRSLQDGKTPMVLNGLSMVHKVHFLATLYEKEDRGIVVITSDEATANRMAEELNRMTGKETAVIYPEREFTYYQVDSVSREYEQLRLGVLRKMQRNPNLVVFASVQAVFQPTIDPQILQKSIETLRVGDQISMENFIGKLIRLGYVRADQVDGIGQFATRGGIIDFFSPQYSWPIRIELWGDEIDSISAFDVETQRREDTMKSVEIAPVKELLFDPQTLAEEIGARYDRLSPKLKELNKDTVGRDLELLETGCALETVDRYTRLLPECSASLLSYAESRRIGLTEGISVRESYVHSVWQQQEDITACMEQGNVMPECAFLYPEITEFWEIIGKKISFIMDSFPRSYNEIPVRSLYTIAANTVSTWSGNLDNLTEDLNDYLNHGWKVWILGGTERGSLAIMSDLERRNFDPKFARNPDQAEGACLVVMPGALSSGFEYPELRWAVISCARTSVNLASGKTKRRKNTGGEIRQLTELVPGEPVVHSSHGIGIFAGIVKREFDGITKDYIQINYAGTDVLFVPVTQLDLVTKYVGGQDAEHVKLNKLSGNDWNRTKLRVKQAVEDMANELIDLYAKRSVAKGFAFSEDSDWQTEFEQRFEYEETDDQLRCVEEIKRDMEQPQPMDRLLCGDVGFGKTEVALRAVFKCVLDGKQCAVMVPTTILAWQHYQTFCRRLEGYPVTIELLSRFRTPKQQKEIIKKLADGTVDVVVGTHRLAQNDIIFRDLGLCVIDEEQRFGVRHKEKLKQMKGNVDVLTLSATPIPRTLNMAMSGIRDMSMLNEAPQDRHPVQTYVLEYDEKIILEAIQKELRRGGQVFYLHNRIENIESTAVKLGELLPEARIMVAHGRMDEDELSQIWKKLVEQEIDILVCTTIIEAGIDVPNCNTLIIENADHMGLAQLYQLRGRVGRSQRRAYAYFTFRKGKVLTELGQKRLEAIREFTSFGSGFHIAMRDLEIRGAGNILGGQQHGQMEAVGYDLYLKLLEEAIREQKGEPQKENIECLVDIQLEAHIPEKYIPVLAQRIDIYKKIAAINSHEQYEDVLDELIDRFGDPPKSVIGLLDVALIRSRAAHLTIHEIDERNGYILYYIDKIQKDVLGSISRQLFGRVRLNNGIRPYLAVKMQPKQTPLEAISEVLTALEEASSTLENS